MTILPNPEYNSVFKQKRILVNNEKGERGIRASNSRWSWPGKCIQYTGEDRKVHYLNYNSAKKFLKSHNIDVKKLSDMGIINEISQIGKNSKIISQSTPSTPLISTTENFVYQQSNQPVTINKPVAEQQDSKQVPLSTQPMVKPVHQQSNQPIDDHQETKIPQNAPKLHAYQLITLLDPELLPHLEDNISKQNDPGLGYSASMIDMLLLRHFQQSQQGGICLGNDGITLDNFDKKVAYTTDFHLYPENNVLGGLDRLKKILSNIVENPNQYIPSKIIIPCKLNSPGKVEHTVVMVIEPDPVNRRKANITMVNFHGNSLTINHAEEQMILNAAKQIYNDPNTSDQK